MPGGQGQGLKPLPNVPPMPGMTAPLSAFSGAAAAGTAPGHKAPVALEDLEGRMGMAHAAGGGGGAAGQVAPPKPRESPMGPSAVLIAMVGGLEPHPTPTPTPRAAAAGLAAQPDARLPLLLHGVELAAAVQSMCRRLTRLPASSFPPPPPLPGSGSTAGLWRAQPAPGLRPAPASACREQRSWEGAARHA